MILERVELPAFLAGRGVERDDLEVAGGDVHHAIDDQGRAFDGLARAAFFEFARVVGPGWGECGHVVAVDLVEGRVAGGAWVVADAGPVDIRRELGQRHGEQ